MAAIHSIPRIAILLYLAVFNVQDPTRLIALHRRLLASPAMQTLPCQQLLPALLINSMELMIFPPRILVVTVIIIIIVILFLPIESCPLLSRTS
jgi:hypothetical protein